MNKENNHNQNLVNAFNYTKLNNHFLTAKSISPYNSWNKELTNSFKRTQTSLSKSNPYLEELQSLKNLNPKQYIPNYPLKNTLNSLNKLLPSSNYSFATEYVRPMQFSKSSLSLYKANEITSSITKWESIYKNSFKRTNLASTIPKDIFQTTSVEEIQSLANNFRNQDFRFPNMISEILDKTESLSQATDTNIDQEIENFYTKETDHNDQTDIEEDIFPSYYSLGFVKALFSFYKSNKDTQFTAKISIKGEIFTFADFIHSYPNIIQNIMYICLLMNDFILEPMENVMTLISFINWLLSIFN
ncbi:hypothetical protein OZX56_05375 [Lactobacillus sp. ESL0684]|uniref:hypothetical protein n=1 Tax=Lactobacillus sp. ESL0684 TaxID=2983213 RepID=UPI0023F81172|nr:hypothetical protein [Lactobacillus sp. ESL0684]WEV42980.1 hypothetical protein OZX56_05375 [Lactobacillus sp. ESL0684]